jgi:3-hydroxyacyl-CoA dehydrogenase
MRTATAVAASSVRKRTVRLHKEAPGHVENRPPGPVAREVSHLVAQGVARHYSFLASFHL